MFLSQYNQRQCDRIPDLGMQMYLDAVQSLHTWPLREAMYLDAVQSLHLAPQGGLVC